MPRQRRSRAGRRQFAAAAANGAKLRYMLGLRPIIARVWDMLVRELVNRSDALDDLRDRIVKIIERDAPSLIGEIGEKTARENLRQLRLVLGSRINPRTDLGTTIALDDFRRRNVALITKLTDDMRARVEDIVAENFAGRVESLSQALREGLDFSKARANLIARDQTLKLNGELTRVRQQNSGISEYVWTTAGDERVRDEHASKDGERFRWDVPPSDTGHPGEDYQCRCTAYPVIPGLED